MSPRSGAGQGQCPHADPAWLGGGAVWALAPATRPASVPRGSASSSTQRPSPPPGHDRPTERAVGQRGAGRGASGRGVGTGQSGLTSSSRGRTPGPTAPQLQQQARGQVPSQVPAPRAGLLPGTDAPAGAARPTTPREPRHQRSLTTARLQEAQRRGTKGTGQAGCQRGQRGLSEEATALPSGHHRAGYSGLG